MVKKAFSAIIIACLLFGFTAANSAAQPAIIQTTTFIDVGQGDATLLTDGSGFNVLIDGGDVPAGPTVLGFLHAAGITHLNVVLASHADSDHIGGLIAVLQDSTIAVDQVVFNGYEGNTDTWTAFLDTIAARGIPLDVIQSPADFNWGLLDVSVLNPIAGLTSPETNEASVVLRVDYHETSYLFTGDIDSSVEAVIPARGVPLAADILKVAHHGSSSGSSEAFLAAVSPNDAVISVGADNDYHHPSPDTLTRLENSGANIWRTDYNGNLVVTSDGFQYSIVPEIIPVWIYLPSIFYNYSPPPDNVQRTGVITISSIFYDGTGSAEPDEYVEIRNDDANAITLSNWTLSDAQAHEYTFPAYVIRPGEICRIYTNEYHPETCGFSYMRGSSIWTNGGDTATLLDSQGTLIDQLSYIGE
ncbi:MAG TPA: lamin tail domain-containing protein [Anaerolineaceae bacterium]|nr:lamin tail domain-containing protein [Anaerolineaceae bacterium]